MTNNLFKYATSELSQDAFICWFLAWADPKYACVEAELHVAAQNMIQNLCEEPELIIETVEVKRQVEKVDVLILVNTDKVILIEDKTDTSEHSGQLRRYKEAISERYTGRNLHPIYLKTGEQSNLSAVHAENYRVFSRTDFLAGLTVASESKNQIFIDYLSYLNEIDADFNSYETLPVTEWTGRAWQGFFQACQSGFPYKDLGWHYVSNPSGGFWGMWFNWKKFTFNDNGNEFNGLLYFQFEENKLCIKIQVSEKGSRRDAMYFWRDRICGDGKLKALGFLKPTRLRQGVCMTVAVNDHFLDCQSGFSEIAIQSLINKLKSIDDCLSENMVSRKCDNNS